MIHIKDTKKAEVILVLDREQNFLTGLKDNLVILNGVQGDAHADIAQFIRQNATLKSIDTQIKKGLNIQSDLLKVVYYAIENVELWLGRLREQISKSSTQTYDANTVTFKERGILDAISAVNFFNRYTTMLVDVLTTHAYDKTDLAKMVSKVDLEFFNNTSAYYASLVIRFNHPVKELSKIIDQLSDEVADELSEDILKGAEGEGAVSIRRGLSPHQINPVHWYLVWAMKKDVQAIKNGQAQIDLLAMKIARLNNKASGVEDPTLDHQIEVYSDEIVKIKARIRSTLEKYNG